MEFEDDYTEEQKALLWQHRATVKETNKSTEYWLNQKKNVKHVMKWQKTHRKEYRKYNCELQKKRYREGKMKKYPATVCARQAAQVRMRNHARKRVRITKNTMIDLLKNEEKRIAANFMDEAINGKRKKTIFCILGDSGGGKTLASLHLKFKHGANVICSYTTRPPRREEENGRDHYFVDIIPSEDQLLAYTKFGLDRHKYYATKSQVSGPVTVYVVDEKGLLYMKEKWGDEYKIYAIYIKRLHHLKIASGVDKARARRDWVREHLPDETYDEIFENNGTKKALFDKVEEIYFKLMEESKQYGW